MPTITTPDADTIEPDLVLEMTTPSRSRTITHPLAAGGVVYTLRPADPRAGTLRLFFLTRADAWACHDAHATQLGAFEYDDDDNPERSLSYVPTGTIEPQLDDATRRRWVVEIDYGEVPA